jgi:hypothetical protein
VTFRTDDFPCLTAEMAAAVSSCMICMDDAYNKTTKVPTECLFCHEVICRMCLKQTLLHDTAVDVCCPGCRAVWSEDFLVANLPVTFRTSELKKHREKVLYDREKVRLPMFMDDARRYKAALDAATPLRKEMDALKAQYRLHPLVIEYKTMKDAMRRPDMRSDVRYAMRLDAQKVKAAIRTSVPTHPGIELLKRRLREFQRPIQTLGLEAPAEAAGGAAGGEPAAALQRRIVMACPATACAGFVNTLWKCGICDTKVCKECRAIKSAGEEHECNADDVATTRAIVAESKPCPKCAASISKVSGCDQMWCTLCHTTFSWDTGKVATTVVHNPHYFQWLASTGRAVPRADLPGMGCDVDGNIMRAIGNLYHAVHHAVHQNHTVDVRTRMALIDRIAERHRQRLDMEAGELRRVRDRVRDYVDGGWRRDMCVKRLAGDMSDEDWRVALQRADKAHHKERAWLQLMEMYAVTTRDIMGRITLESASVMLEGAFLEDILHQHDQLHQFAYEQNLAISKAYGCIVLKFTPDMKAPEKKKRAPKAAVGGAGAATETDD